MNATDKAMQEAVRAMDAASPKNGFRPETEEEWTKALAACEKMGYAMYLVAGVPDAKARALAHAIHGGKAGRLLLQIAFDVDRARYG